MKKKELGGGWGVDLIVEGWLALIVLFGAFVLMVSVFSS